MRCRRQTLRKSDEPATSSNNRSLYLWQAEGRGVRSDDQVAGERDLEATSYCGPLDCRDERLASDPRSETREPTTRG